MSQIKWLTVQDVLMSSEIYFDPNPNDTNLSQDKEWLSDFALLPDTECDCK